MSATAGMQNTIVCIKDLIARLTKSKLPVACFLTYSRPLSYKYVCLIACPFLVSPLTSIPPHEELS